MLRTVGSLQEAFLSGRHVCRGAHREDAPAGWRRKERGASGRGRQEQKKIDAVGAAPERLMKDLSLPHPPSFGLSAPKPPQSGEG